MFRYNAPSTRLIHRQRHIYLRGAHICHPNGQHAPLARFLQLYDAKQNICWCGVGCAWAYQCYGFAVDLNHVFRWSQLVGRFCLYHPILRLLPSIFGVHSSKAFSPLRAANGTEIIGERKDPQGPYEAKGGEENLGIDEAHFTQKNELNDV